MNNLIDLSFWDNPRTRTGFVKPETKNLVLEVGKTYKFKQDPDAKVLRLLSNYTTREYDEDDMPYYSIRIYGDDSLYLELYGENPYNLQLQVYLGYNNKTYNYYYECDCNHSDTYDNDCDNILTHEWENGEVGQFTITEMFKNNLEDMGLTLEDLTPLFESVV